MTLGPLMVDLEGTELQPNEREMVMLLAVYLGARPA